MTVLVFVQKVLVIVEMAEDVIRVFVIAEILRHFSIFTAVNVEGKVLIELESVERNNLKLGESGVDEALQWLTASHCFQSLDQKLVTQTPNK